MAPTEEFDPYRKWLGIPAEHQPPHHYRLLGLEPFEADPDVIESAADARMAHLRTFQTGKRAAVSQRLLNEIAAAKVVLLDAEKKASYDAQLREKLKLVSPAIPPAQATPVRPPVAVPLAERSGDVQASLDAPPPTIDTRHLVRRRHRHLVSIGATVLLLLGAGIGVAALVAMLSDEEPVVQGSLAQEVPGSLPGGIVPADVPPSDQSDSGGGTPSPGGSSLTEPSTPMNGGDGASRDAAGTGSGGGDPAVAIPGTPAANPGSPPPAVPDGTSVPPAEVPDGSSVPPADDSEVVVAVNSGSGDSSVADAAPPSTNPGGVGPAPNPNAPSVPNEDPVVATQETALVVDRRQPLPDAESLAAARQAVQSVFGNQITEARSVEEKRQFARSLFDVAIDTRDNPAERYALLERAGQLAIESQDGGLALDVSDELARSFRLADPLRQQYLVFDALAGRARSTQELRGVAEAGMRVGEALLAGNEYENAVNVLQRSRDAAARARETELARQITARAAEAERLRIAWESVQPYAARLASDPADQEAALAVGRFVAFVKGDWPRGSSLILQADDAAVAPLVRSEQAAPVEPRAQVDLADRWWQLAEEAPAAEQDAIRRRAYRWYRQAAPHLDGLTKARVESRLRNAPADLAEAEDAEDSPVAHIKGFDTRKDEHRQLLLDTYGGNERTEAAVAAALQWIVRHQQALGNWNYNHRQRQAWPGRGPGGRFPGGGGQGDRGSHSEALSGATAVAMLPLLASGSTHQHGPYKDQIGRGLLFLGTRIQRTAAGGSLRENQGGMFSHFRAAQAIAEAYGMTGDRAVQQLGGQPTVDYIVASQSSADGGWGDRPGDPSDTLRFFWAMSALQAARWANLNVPQKTFDQAAGYLDKVKGDGGKEYYGRVEVRGQPAERASTYTAIGMLGRMYLGARPSDPLLKEAAEQLAASGPQRENLFHNFVVNELLFHYGGKPWEQWNPRMQQFLLQAQTLDGPDAGSWYFAGDPTSQTGGRLLHTAMASLMLQIYYRNPRVVLSPAR